MLTKTNKPRNKQPQNRAKNTNRRGGYQPIRTVANQIPRALQREAPFPPEVEVDLVFNCHSTKLVSPATNFAIKEFKLNSPFDPEGGGGGTQPTGLLEWGSMYNLLRVMSVKIDITFSNMETDNALYVTWIARDKQITTDLTTVDRIKNAVEVSPTSGVRELGVRDGPARGRISVPFYRLADVVGDRTTYAGDQGFTSAINADPNQLVWGAIVIYNDDDTGLTFLGAGLSYKIRIIMRTKFFGVRNLYSDALVIVEINGVKRIKKKDAPKPVCVCCYCKAARAEPPAVSPDQIRWEEVSLEAEVPHEIMPYSTKPQYPCGRGGSMCDDSQQ